MHSCVALAGNCLPHQLSLLSVWPGLSYAGIIQLSDSLARGGCGDLGEKGRHFAGTIKNSSNHLLNIINDILDAAALKVRGAACRRCVAVLCAALACLLVLACERLLVVLTHMHLGQRWW